MKKLSLFFILLVSITMFQSCEKDPVIQEPENVVAPTLPTQQMMVMPTSEFRNGGDPDTTVVNPNGVTYWNALHAGLNILVWNTVVVANLAAPTAAFGAALNQQAEYIGDNTFEWDYSFVAENINQKTYHIVLTGQYINNFQEVEWILTASEVGGFTDFVWYTGIVDSDLRSGVFTLYDRPNNPRPVLSLAYEGDENSEDGSLRLTNITPNNPDNGDYIEYREDSDLEFNRAYDVKRGNNNLLEIQWDEPSGNGRVKHPNHFNDSDWHCWDENNIDIEC